MFGDVIVTRKAYRQPGRANLHPADADLNLPVEAHCHGLRRLAAIEATRGSYDATAAAIGRATGHQVGHRQLQQLVERAAADFDGFYASRPPPLADGNDVLVLSADGKGIVMRPDGLRAANAAANANCRLLRLLARPVRRRPPTPGVRLAVDHLHRARRVRRPRPALADTWPSNASSDSSRATPTGRTSIRRCANASAATRTHIPAG